MQGRALKVRRVFAELRQALGGDVPAGELLQLAAKLVNATHPQDERDYGDLASPRQTFDELPLDMAFADGGWRIMARERSCNVGQFDEDPSMRERSRTKLNAILKRAA